MARDPDPLLHLPNPGILSSTWSVLLMRLPLSFSFDWLGPFISSITSDWLFLGISISFMNLIFVSWVDVCISCRCLCFLDHVPLFFVLAKCVYGHLFALSALTLERTYFGGEPRCLIFSFYFCFCVGTSTCEVCWLVNYLFVFLSVYESHLLFFSVSWSSFVPSVGCCDVSCSWSWPLHQFAQGQGKLLCLVSRSN